MPGFSHTVEVDAPPSEVFALLDDVERTPEWLTRCTRMEKLDEGPNTVGTKLKYHYKEGRSTGQMDGHITARQPDERITMLYTDKLMDVTVDALVAPGRTAGSSSVTNTIDIRTKGLGKVFTPVIKRTLPKQTTDAMQRLKAVVESGR